MKKIASFKQTNSPPSPFARREGQLGHYKSPLLRFFFNGGLDHGPRDDEGLFGDGQGEACAVAALGQAILAGETFPGNCAGGLVAVEADAPLLRELASQGVQKLGGCALDLVREGSGHVFLPFCLMYLSDLKKKIPIGLSKLDLNSQFVTDLGYIQNQHAGFSIQVTA